MKRAVGGVSFVDRRDQRGYQSERRGNTPSFKHQNGERVKVQRLTSWGLATVILAVVGCSSSTSGAGGAAGGMPGGAAGAAGGGTSGTAGTSGGSSGTGPGGAAGGGQAAGGSTGIGGAGGSGAGGMGGTFVSTTLLVDDDDSDNNDPNSPVQTSSYSDTLFAGLLAGENITYSTFSVPAGNDTDPTVPVFSQLSGVSTIIWYTADNDNGEPPTLSASQETTLGNWLDLGNKTLIIFSENLLFDLAPNWTNTNGDTFLSTYLGLTGGEADVELASGDSLDQDISFVATGAPTVPAFSGLSFAIDANAHLATTADAVNPAIGTDALLTVQADPLVTGTNTTTAVASGHTKGTSKIIYIGIPIEAVHGIPTNTSAQLFHACLKYAGLAAN